MVEQFLKPSFPVLIKIYKKFKKVEKKDLHLAGLFNVCKISKLNFNLEAK